MTNLGRRALGLGRSVISYPLSSTFGDAWMELTGLQLGNRVLVYGGYLAIGIAIAFLLSLQFFVARLDSLLDPLQSLYGAMALGLYVLAWSFLLTAAVQCRRRFALPLIALFVWGLFDHFRAASSLLVPSLFLLLLALTIAVMAVPPLRTLTLRWPLLFFASSFALMGLLTVVDRAAYEVSASSFAGRVVVLILVLYLVAGLALMDLGATIGRWIVEQLSRRFRPVPFYAVLLTILFARTCLALGLLTFAAIMSQGSEAALEQVISANSTLLFMAAFEVLLLIPFLGWLALLALLRRWNVRSVSLVFAMSMLSPIVSVGGLLGTRGQDVSDLTQLTAENLGIIPPYLLLIIFMTVTLLSFGSHFAGTNGRFIPRASRIGLTLGVVLLVLGSIYSSESSSLQYGWGMIGSILLPFQQLFYLIGLMLFTLPYFIFLLIRRRQAFVGTAGLVTPTRSVWPWMDRVAPQRLLGVTIVVGLGTLMLCCGCTELVSSLYFPE